MSGQDSFSKFSRSAEIFDWLSRFINLEQGYTPPSMRPERMQIIGELAGHPERCGVSIHIAGSKGKGSITAMITRILQAGGMRPARYMSPHVVEYRERITLGDDFFDEAVYLAAGEELRRLAGILCDPSSQAYKAMAEVSDGCSPEPTFFELLTLLYFLCARIARCDALVVETGMGGRLDPTNIVDSAASVITGIELEHTEFLGNTLGAVAGEKAGIIKHGRPLILAEQPADALEVFRRTAEEKEAEIFYFPETVSVDNVNVRRGGTDFTLNFKKKGFFDGPLDLSVAIPGEIQGQNAALAVLAVKKTFPAIEAETIRKGLSGFSLPARFEKLCDAPPVIVDGAHTNISARLCVKTFTELYGQGGVLIFGCALGKNDEAMADALLPYFSYIVITTPGTFKMSGPEQVYETFKRRMAADVCGKNGETEIDFVKNTADGIKKAFDRAKRDALPVLGIGSFYLAAEIRDFVKGG
ncbi:MAG: tetrahydrofolate synthase [Spirochaetaceae bacterium]|jgi:dihydrofolate synthase/folylpolyglutamate synthase|nr:tetrahydrofolate synthase [Spirochaetaceae bacterium]